MAAPSKAAQDAEGNARAEAGIQPGDNTQALDVVDADGAAGGDEAARAAPAPAAEPAERTAPPVRSEFNSRRDEIAKRFRADRTTEAAEQADDISDFARSGLPPEFAAPPINLEPAQAEQGEQAEGADAGADESQQAAPPQKVKIKVRGQELEVPLEDVLAKAQIAYAADDYLDEAKSKLDEVNNLLRSTKEQAPRPGQQGQHQAPQNGANPQPSPATDPAAEHPGDEIDKLIETLQFGDPTEAKALLKNTISGEAGKAVSQELQSQRLRDEGTRAAKVLKDFEEAHPEIANDKRARAAIESDILDLQVEDIKALGIDPDKLRPDGNPPTPGDIAVAHRWYRANGFQVRSPQEMLETATKEFLNWKGVAGDKPAGTAPRAAPRVDVTVDRTARRQAIPQQPSRSAAPQPATPAAPAQPRDRSEIVRAEMARRNLARGRVVA